MTTFPRETPAGNFASSPMYSCRDAIPDVSISAKTAKSTNNRQKAKSCFGRLAAFLNSSEPCRFSGTLPRSSPGARFVPEACWRRMIGGVAIINGLHPSWQRRSKFSCISRFCFAYITASQEVTILGDTNEKQGRMHAEEEIAKHTQIKTITESSRPSPVG